ncbi:hypothetical protein GCM10009092_09820 [Bowmanella denitrificans]|uniref:Solute-binding protein family 3/N-terminal domain-containing protein n=1 Tax=Bowmanella denitrificans TaxID=366582 RepID=A0ABP3GN32_9ALTE|nr:hypothetical protein [Bowmanella denitrificans]
MSALQRKDWSWHTGLHSAFNRWQWIIGLALLIPYMSIATELTPASQKMLLTHIQHSQKQPFIDFITTVYQDLGIDVTTQAVPSVDEFTLLERGETDAAVLLVKENAMAHKNLVIVEPAIYEADLVLLCKRKDTCDLSVLQSQDNAIFTNLGDIATIQTMGVKSQLFFESSLTDSLSMLRNGRVDFLLYGTTKAEVRQLKAEFNLIEVKKLSMHHVIHNKHAKLLPALQSTIRRKLPAFKPH